MSKTPLLQQLVEAFRCLPGVGTKTANRMSYHLLERNREGAKQLANTLLKAMDDIHHCQRCRTFTENELCHICSNPKRNKNILCLVESPSDLQAIELTAGYSGVYFVLMGHLSPLDGIGPDDIGLKELEYLLEQEPPEEIIFALSASVEGDATCHYIAQMCQDFNIKISRIAQGIPMGGELEHLDAGTLAMSLNTRTRY